MNNKRKQNIEYLLYLDRNAHKHNNRLLKNICNSIWNITDHNKKLEIVEFIKDNPEKSVTKKFQSCITKFTKSNVKFSDLYFTNTKRIIVKGNCVECNNPLIKVERSLFLCKLCKTNYHFDGANFNKLNKELKNV